MERVQCGDESAFEELFSRYRAPLFAFLLRRLGNGAEEDLFQETWLRLVRARHRYDPKRRFATWLFQIANNLCRDRARRRAVEARGRARISGTAATSTPAAATALEVQSEVNDHLSALSERLREVLVLRYYHDLSENEIAEIAGVPRGTVKSRLHAAVRALREITGMPDAD